MSGGPVIRHEGSPIRKKIVSLGVPRFIFFPDVITLPLWHLLLRVRLLWFVCAKTRRFSQTSTVFAELDRSRSKNSTVFAELDGFCRIKHNYIGSLIHSAHCIVIQLISVRNILNHSTHIIDECVFCFLLGVCSNATNKCLVEVHFTLAFYFLELQSTVFASTLVQ